MRLRTTPVTRRAGVILLAVATSSALLSAPMVSAQTSTQLGRAELSNATPPAAITGQATTGSTAVPSNVRLVRIRTSLLGTHKWYRQIKDGHVVAGAWYARHIDAAGNVTVWDSRKHVGKVAATTAQISRQGASSTAAQASDASAPQVNDASLVVLPGSNGVGAARLAWAVSTATGAGAATTYVDATTGDVVKTVTWSKKAPAGADATTKGTGRVFDPNPVVALQDESLTDMGDSVEAVPAAGYRTVLLRRLDESHSLAGLWVRIANASRAGSPTDDYLFDRADNRFEQVNAYYAVDAQQAYLRSLGLTDVNAESEKVKVNAFATDNSYYDPSTDMISLGKGGVDDAEDAEVVWHEYGHAIQADQVLDFGWTRQAQAIGEGFGDYMSVTMSQPSAADTSKTPTACVMDWDATSYTTAKPHCLRRTDGDKTYPADLTGEEHSDGEIWSRALWDMNLRLSRDTATTVIVEAQFWMNPKVGMPEAARITVSTARELYGDSVAVTTRRAFIRRGIL